MRRAKGKEYAEIYDFITLPRPLDKVGFCSEDELMYDLTLVRKEFDRMLDFASTARNQFDIDSIKEKILTTYSNIYIGGLSDE